MSGLSRDTEHANDGSISPIFDKEKEQRQACSRRSWSTTLPPMRLTLQHA
ncbi:hypothetical protein WDV93_20705 [Pantoea ananatis]